MTIMYEIDDDSEFKSSNLPKFFQLETDDGAGNLSNIMINAADITAIWTRQIVATKISNITQISTKDGRVWSVTQSYKDIQKLLNHAGFEIIKRASCSCRN